MVRRKFITTLTATAAATTNISQSGWLSDFFFDYKKPVPGIPKQWVDLKGVSVYEYANFILKLDLKNITPYMVLSSHFKTRRHTLNDIPPREMWKNIKPTLRAVDKISTDMGISIKEILSAYRSPAYNKAVRGNKGSFHMTNQAIDVRFNNISTWKAGKVIRNCRDSERLFEGGVGVYRGFIHIDTRGYKADW